MLRNTELRIDYVAHRELERLDALPIVEDLSGVAVDVDWTRSLAMLRGKLRTPLAAMTSYRIRHLFAPCAADQQCSVDNGLCPSAAGTTLTTFTTGDQLDETKPAAVAITLSETIPTIRVTQTSACGPFDRCSYVWTHGRLEAGQFLRVKRGDQTLFEPRSEGSFFIDSYVEGSRFTPISGAPHQLGGADYQVYVVDGAGNLSDPVPLSVPACAPYDPATADAGAIPLLDAGATDSGVTVADSGAPGTDGGLVGALDSGAPDSGQAVVVDDDDSGCSAAKPGQRSTAWSWLLVTALGVVVRRRTRTPRTH